MPKTLEKIVIFLFKTLLPPLFLYSFGILKQPTTALILMSMLKVCGGSIGSGLQVGNDINHDRKPYDTQVVRFLSY